MSVRIVERSDLTPFVSPQRNKYTAVHSWYTFKHGYSRDLAAYLISHFNLSAGSWVLDPFCGSGTTLLACRELGINSRGFDILPFSVYLSNVKIRDYSEEQLTEQLRILVDDYRDRSEVITLPDIPLINKAFEPQVKSELLNLKARIEKIRDSKTRALFNLAFLSILESVSNTTKSGGFLRIVHRDVSAARVRSLFFDKASSMVNDVRKLNKNGRYERVSSLAQLGDARRLPTRRKYDAVITSPPYPNRHDYTRIYSLEMVFDFVSSNDELKKVRYETLRSHVEARKKYEVSGYVKPETLDSLLAQVKKNGTNNPQVISMLEGYFEDMHLSLSEIARCLKKGGKVALVVSNVRFAGVNIVVDEILADIGSRIGLVPEEIWAVKYRGNSSQQMRDYARKPSRESVVIWGKNAD